MDSNQKLLEAICMAYHALYPYSKLLLTPDLLQEVTDNEEYITENYPVIVVTDNNYINDEEPKEIIFVDSYDRDTYLKFFSSFIGQIFISTAHKGCWH